MPEARPGGSVRVIARHRESLGLCREAVPAQGRGNVLAAHAETVVDLGIAHLLAVGDVVAFNGERRDFRQDVLRKRSAFSHGFLQFGTGRSQVNATEASTAPGARRCHMAVRVRLTLCPYWRLAGFGNREDRAGVVRVTRGPATWAKRAFVAIVLVGAAVIPGRASSGQPQHCTGIRCTAAGSILWTAGLSGLWLAQPGVLGTVPG